MVRRYSLEQEEFVRKRIDKGIATPAIRDAFQARFPESHAANPFELNQVSYLRKKHKEIALGFRNPGFREQVDRINEKRAAEGQPLMGEATDVEDEDDHEVEGEGDGEQASNAGNSARSPQALQNVTDGSVTLDTIVVATEPPAPAQAPASDLATQAPVQVQTRSRAKPPAPAQAPASDLATQAPVQVQTRSRAEPRAASGPIAAYARFLTAPDNSSVPHPPAAQTATSNAIKLPQLVPPFSVGSGKTLATDGPDVSGPAQEPGRGITSIPTRNGDDMARIVPGPNAGQHEQSNLPAPASGINAMDAFEQWQKALTKLPQFTLGEFRPGMRNTSLSGLKPQRTINPAKLMKSACTVSTSAPNPVLQVAAGPQLALNAYQHLGHTETSRLSQADTDSTLGKRKTASSPDLAATGENGEKRPKLSQMQPDTRSHTADAAKPDESGIMSLSSVLEPGSRLSSAHGSNQGAPDQPTHTGPVNIEPASHDLTAALPQMEAGGNGEASQGGKLDLHVDGGGSATLQETCSQAPGPQPHFSGLVAPAHIGLLQPAAPMQPARPPGTLPGLLHGAHLPVPSVRDFKRAANPTISSEFPRIGEKETSQSGQGRAADALLHRSGGPDQAPGPGGKAEAARQEDYMFQRIMVEQEIIDAAIQAGKDVQNMIVSSKDTNHPHSSTRESKALVPGPAIPITGAQQASMRLNRALYPAVESPAVRVTSTPEGPVIKEAPQPSAEGAEVYYVTTPMPEVDVRPCIVGALCPVPASVFHFHCEVNKTVLFNSMDDFKRAATEYAKAQQDRAMLEED
ncbi:hypothetical protein RB595_005148 [Gaeumannomyces hyphopodioides]